MAAARARGLREREELELSESVGQARVGAAKPPDFAAVQMQPEQANRHLMAMVRPCFLVVDPEHSGSISTRKLVIESAKLNVITAYSGGEAIETLNKFPAVDGVVCNTEMRDMPVYRLVAALKEHNPKVPVILVGPGAGGTPQADYHVDSFDPKRLLELLQELVPAKISAISDYESELRDNESS